MYSARCENLVSLSKQSFIKSKSLSWLGPSDSGIVCGREIIVGFGFDSVLASGDVVLFRWDRGDLRLYVGPGGLFDGRNFFVFSFDVGVVSRARLLSLSLESSSVDDDDDGGAG